MTTTRTRSSSRTAKVSQAEKDRRAAARVAAVEELSGKLSDAVMNLATAEGWRAAVRAVARLDPRRYSANNLLLITLQCPEATAVAGVREWNRRGRLVRKGSTGLRIFAGMTLDQLDKDGNTVTAEDGTPKTRTRFKAQSVFDISQTVPMDGVEPEPVPSVGAKVRGAAPEGMWSALAAHLGRSGYTVERGDTGRADGWTDPRTNTVRVSAADPEAHAAITLAHEAGHVECGHMGDMAAYRAHRGRMETEAEAFAYIVSAWFGLDAELTSAPYIAGWAGSTPEAVEKTMRETLATVVKAVCRLLDSIDPAAPDEQRDDQAEEQAPGGADAAALGQAA